MSWPDEAVSIPDHRPMPKGPRGRYESKDGRRTLDVHLALQGARDFQAAILRAAKVLAERPALHEACVAVRLPRLSNERILQEWRQTKALLRPQLSDRLALIVLGTKEPWSDPQEPHLVKIGRRLGAKPVMEVRNAIAHLGSGRKVYEVFKVLMDHWLRRLGPISISQLMMASGCSYPTVAECIERLEETREVARRSNRSVEVVAFPRRMWGELLMVCDAYPRGMTFVDATGQTPDLRAMLQRIGSLRRKDLALGGVHAARHYDRHFDLHGTPRLDLCMYAPAGITDLGLMKQIDPALRVSSKRGEIGVLAIHLVTRPRPAFEPSSKGLPWASPVETLLDLHELRLGEQANDLIAKLTQAKEAS